jgi:hypothetical protein
MMRCSWKGKEGGAAEWSGLSGIQGRDPKFSVGDGCKEKQKEKENKNININNKIDNKNKNINN